jgi:hypothetical protein
MNDSSQETKESLEILIAGPIRMSSSIDKLAIALTNAQSEMEPAAKTAENSYLGNTYADLTTVWNACRGALTRNELCVMQPLSADPQGGMVSVTTMLCHSSGQWMSCTMYAKPKDMSPQSIGSAATYLKRYGLAGMVGVVTVDEDDDGVRSTQGEHAGNRGARPQGNKQPQGSGTDGQEKGQKAPPTIDQKLNKAFHYFKATTDKQQNELTALTLGTKKTRAQLNDLEKQTLFDMLQKRKQEAEAEAGKGQQAEGSHAA